MRHLWRSSPLGTRSTYLQRKEWWDRGRNTVNTDYPHTTSPVQCQLWPGSSLLQGSVSCCSWTSPSTTLARDLHLSTLLGTSLSLMESGSWVEECLLPGDFSSLVPNTVEVEYRLMDWNNELEWRRLKNSEAELFLLPFSIAGLYCERIPVSDIQSRGASICLLRRLDFYFLPDELTRPGVLIHSKNGPSPWRRELLSVWSLSVYSCLEREKYLELRTVGQSDWAQPTGSLFVVNWDLRLHISPSRDINYLWVGGTTLWLHQHYQSPDCPAGQTGSDWKYVCDVWLIPPSYWMIGQVRNVQRHDGHGTS